MGGDNELVKIILEFAIFTLLLFGFVSSIGKCNRAVAPPDVRAIPTAKAEVF